MVWIATFYSLFERNSTQQNITDYMIDFCFTCSKSIQISIEQWNYSRSSLLLVGHTKWLKMIERKTLCENHFIMKFDVSYDTSSSNIKPSGNALLKILFRFLFSCSFYHSFRFSILIAVIMTTMPWLVLLIFFYYYLAEVCLFDDFITQQQQSVKFAKDLPLLPQKLKKKKKWNIYTIYT